MVVVVVSPWLDVLFLVLAVLPLDPCVAVDVLVDLKPFLAAKAGLPAARARAPDAAATMSFSLFVSSRCAAGKR